MCACEPTQLPRTESTFQATDGIHRIERGLNEVFRVVFFHELYDFLAQARCTRLLTRERSGLNDLSQVQP